MVKKLKEKKCVSNILALACFITNISQMPIFVTVGITQYLNMPIWIITLLYLLIYNNGVLIVNNRIKYPIVCICITVIFSLLWTVETDYSYVDSSILSSLLICVFIFLIGLYAKKDFDYVDIKHIAIAYAMSAIIVSINIYLEYFSSGYNLLSKSYAYASKNSISQIIFTSIILLMYVRLDKRFFMQFFRCVGIVVEIISLILLRSRATILGLFVCILYLVFAKPTNKKIKLVIGIVLFIFIVTLLCNINFRNIFLNGIVFAGRDASSINDLSSGRIEILSSFPSYIKGNWLTGIGSIYFECFPLAVILNFGALVAIFIICFSYNPMYKAIKYRKFGIYYEMFFMIAIGYTFNSLFEGLAPLGPGTKCYFMWLLFGLLDF